MLSDAEIREHLETGEIKLEPSDLSACLNPAGYDLRCSRTVVLKPKQYMLVATLETVELGLGVVAFLHIRSSLAREGVVGSFAVVDPGFRGQLTLNLHNVSDKEVHFERGGTYSSDCFPSAWKHGKDGLQWVIPEQQRNSDKQKK